MFLEKAADFNGVLKRLTLFPSARERDYWEALPVEWKSSLIKAGNERLGWKFSPIPATLFMDFKRSGNRTRLEEVYFEKRYVLADLILAECVEGKGRFLDDIVNGIFSICEESAWQLPAHNTYIRDTPQELLPDITRPILDLFACETGALLAVAYALLGDSFEQIHPFINSNLLICIRRRIIIPYLNEKFWWMGQWDAPICNWTIWCTQNILLTVFLMPEVMPSDPLEKQSDTPSPMVQQIMDVPWKNGPVKMPLPSGKIALLSFIDKNSTAMPDIRRRVFYKACQSIDFFIDSYGEDGCCDEGAQYYRHAGLCLFHTLELLNGMTDQFFSDLYQDTKIQKIAEYILNVHINDIYYINYADCSPVAGFAGVREFLFGKRIGNRNMMNFAAKQFRKNPDKLLAKEINLSYRVQNALTYSEIMAFDTSDPVLYQDIFYPSVGLFIARDDSRSAVLKEGQGYCLAMKAGDNDDSHNHNDTGSFTIYKNGLPMFIDIGVETYTKKTFSPQRYTIWTMQSQYHNLPTINGFQQKAGASYHAVDVDYQLGEKNCSICMDIAPAYPKKANLASYIRKAVLVKGEKICITDTFRFTKEGNHQIFLSFLTYEKPILSEPIEPTDLSASIEKNNQKENPALNNPSTLQSLSIGTLGSLKLTGITSVQIEEIPIKDERLKLAWKHEIYRITATADCQAGKIEMEIQ